MHMMSYLALRYVGVMHHSKPISYLITPQELYMAVKVSAMQKSFKALSVKSY